MVTRAELDIRLEELVGKAISFEPPRAGIFGIRRHDHMNDPPIPNERVEKAKVLCYIVRGRQALGFSPYAVHVRRSRHPSAGRSIRAGETPQAAALREAQEETGLTDFRVVRKLGVADYDISPYRLEIQKRHFFHLELDSPTPER